MSKLIIFLAILLCSSSMIVFAQKSDLYNSVNVKVTEGKGDIKPNYSNCISFFRGSKFETLFSPFSDIQPVSNAVEDQQTWVKSNGSGKIEIITERGSAAFQRDNLNCTGTSRDENLSKVFADELNSLKKSYKQMNKNDSATVRTILNSKSCRALYEVDEEESFFSLAPTKDTIVLPTVYRAQ